MSSFLFGITRFPRFIRGGRPADPYPGLAIITITGPKKFRAFSDKPLIQEREPRIMKPGPMSRVVFADGTTSKWHLFEFKRKDIVAIESVAPDEYGRMRYTQLKVR